MARGNEGITGADFVAFHDCCEIYLWLYSTKPGVRLEGPARGPMADVLTRTVNSLPRMARLAFHNRVGEWYESNVARKDRE